MGTADSWLIDHIINYTPLKQRTWVL